MNSAQPNLLAILGHHFGAWHVDFRGRDDDQLCKNIDYTVHFAQRARAPADAA